MIAQPTCKYHCCKEVVVCNILYAIAAILMPVCSCLETEKSKKDKKTRRKKGRKGKRDMLRFCFRFILFSRSISQSIFRFMFKFDTLNNVAVLTNYR